MKHTSQENLQNQLVQNYDKLYRALIGLIATLNVLEPGGTLVDDVVFTVKDGSRVRVSYVANPIHITVNTGERKFIFRVVESSADKDFNSTTFIHS